MFSLLRLRSLAWVEERASPDAPQNRVERCPLAAASQLFASAWLRSSPWRLTDDNDPHRNLMLVVNDFRGLTVYFFAEV